MRAVVIALILALAGSARADDNANFAEAKRLEAALEYEAALVIVERLLASGTNSPDAVVALHLWAGKLAAGLDRTSVAEEHFARVLALAPETKLPEGTSPKLTGPFDAARARTSPVRISFTRERGLVVLIAEADEMNLVAGVAVRVVDEAGKVHELREPRGRRVELPDLAGQYDIRVTALDTYGNQIWTKAVVKLSQRKEAAHPTASQPILARWTLWAGITAGVLVVGGVSAWRFDVAQDQWDRLKTTADFSELRDVETHGRRWGLAANISFGAAAITGIVAIIRYVTPPAVQPVPFANSDAVGLAVAGGF